MICSILRCQVNKRSKLSQRGHLISKLLLLILYVSLLGCSGGGGGGSSTDRWEVNITAFEAADLKSPPPQGVVVFVGSSSITGWADLEADMAPLSVINRGFGGSTMVDVNRYRDRIVTNYQPSIVVIYAGENDIASGASVDSLLQQYEAFSRHLEETLPDTKLCFISIKPSPARIDFWADMEWANFRLDRLVATDPGKLCYIDITALMLDEYDEPREELYLADRLHINRQAYQLWAAVIKPRLEAL